MLKRVTMSAFSPKHTRSYNVRSVSFPPRSHPTMRRLEEELKKFSSSEAEDISVRLSGLSEIYRCVGDLLDLPLTQQALANHQEEKWVNEMLDNLIKFLDICGKTRDAILLMKESVRELQSALRRSKGGGGGDHNHSNIESNINGYLFSRKTMKKTATKCLISLKKIETEPEPEPPLIKTEHYLGSVVRMLRETNLITISIFSELLSFLSAAIAKPKPAKWALVVSKLVHRGETEDVKNGLEGVDMALSNLLLESKDLGEKVEFAEGKLEELDVRIEGFENGLDLLFRRLIQNRVSLLNIYTFSLE